jgi:hypothetical protein
MNVPRDSAFTLESEALYVRDPNDTPSLCACW